MELHCVRPPSQLTIHSFRCCPQVIPMFPQAFPQVCPQSPVRGTLGGMRVVHGLWICDTSIKRAACTVHAHTRVHAQAHIRAYTRRPSPCLHRATIGCDKRHTTRCLQSPGSRVQFDSSNGAHHTGRHGPFDSPEYGRRVARMQSDHDGNQSVDPSNTSRSHGA